jgi:subtilisin-like proprotein convertase family protein
MANTASSTAASLPDDPLFARQWHLRNAKGGYDLNLLSVWEDYSGYGIKVIVCDDGVQSSHPDLADNYDPGLSYNFARNRASGDPVGFGDNHGTSVAGVIAAARNGRGAVGVAYDAAIGSVIADSFGELAKGFKFAVNRGADIINNSWGFDAFYDDPLGSEAKSLFKALETAAAAGRGGLGLVMTFAAGNEREDGYDANVNGINSSPYGINVAAADANGRIASYSSPGASVLITGLGGESLPSSPGLITTDRTGSRGYANGDYYTEDYDGYLGFNGTSAATPIISGIAALMLEANPGLGYRDIQEILAYSARISDAKNKTWAFNGADNWNGGGLHTSRDFGFGLVDAHAAVRLAETWDYLSTFDNLDTASRSSGRLNRAIPDGKAAGIASTVRIADDFELDHVTATVHLKHSGFGNLRIDLVSPSGTVSTLIDHTRAKPPGSDFTWMFTSTQFWGESSAGDWKLVVVDDRAGKTGSLVDWSIKVWGDDLAEDGITDDDLYIYTDEYGGFTRAGDAARRTLSDAKGDDTINAAAVTGNSVLDLTPGGRSKIAGNGLTIAPGTVIENAYAGDGDDNVIGNDAANWLYGGRGRDSLTGGAGNDTLLGGEGGDWLTGGAGSDVFVFTGIYDSGTDSAGRDVISDFSFALDRDVIDLSAIDANAKTARVDDAFVFIGGAKFTAPGQLRYSAADFMLEGNVDGNLAADFGIELLGVTALTGSAFLL